MSADPNSDGGISYGAIPAKLTGRDQWVCWRAEERERADGSTDETKVPLKPFDAANPYAKAKSSTWNLDDDGEKLDDPDDPADTWGTFEQAREFHERADTDTAGIGFMFAPNDTIVGVDLDDVHDPETGEIEPGAREILDTLDTYTEFSPTDTGFHALLAGILDSDYNKQPFERENDVLADVFDGDPEVEAYDEGRFFTVTGARVEEYPAGVEARNSDLREVTDEYLSKDYDPAAATLDGFDTPANATGANGNGRAGVTANVDVDLDDDELVAKATNAKNGEKFGDLYAGRWEMYYPSQSEADLAFCGMLAFWSGEDARQMDRIFRDSGLMRPKWDEHRGAQTYGERTIDEALAGNADTYNPGRGGHGHGQGDDPDAVRERVTNDPTLEADGQDVLVPTALDSGIMVTNGGYAIPTADRDAPPKELTNFLLAANHELTTPEGDQYVALTVLPDDDESFDVMVEPGVFNEPRDFRAEVCTALGTRFDGNRHDLGKLRDLLAAANIPRREGTRHIGIYGFGDGDEAEAETGSGAPEAVFPDGTLRADGWTDDPDHVYVERNVEAERQIRLSPDTYPTAEYDRDAVAAALDLLPQTRDPERFLPALGWFYASTFRPFIKAEEDEFSHLTVTGDTGAGKSSSLKTLMDLFGMGKEPFGLRGTKFEVTANMSVPNALPLVYDEYKPSELDDYVLDYFHDFLRKAATGGVEQRGRADGSTESYPLNAPVVVAGESAIQGPAERRRSIMTTFTARAVEHGTATADAFTDLRALDAGDDHALAWYRWVLKTLDDPAAVRKLWETCDQRVAEILDAAGYDAAELDPLPRQGLQTVVFGIAMFRAFAEDMGLDADSAGLRAVDDGPRDRAVVALARELLEGDHRKSHMDQFLEAMSLAAAAEYLEDGDHYTVVKNGKPSALVRVNLNQSYPEVRRYVRDHDLGDDVGLLNYDDYRARFAEAADDALSYVEDYGQPVAIGRTVGIHAPTADDAVSGFEPAAFGVDGPKTDDGLGANAGDEQAQDADDPRRKVLNRLAVLASKTADGSIAEAELVRHVVKLDKIPFSKADHLVGRLRKEGHILDATTDGGEPRVRPLDD